jgi:L-ascorbate metabolism protein UlaG (beta-lactamase superfamily)
MKKYSFFYLILFVGLCGCKAFKPSADLLRFEEYYAKEDNRRTTDQLKITFFGTSTLLFDDGETQLFIDGFLSRPPLGKVAFGKVRTDEKLIYQLIAKHNINRLKATFVCHSHYDHAMDAPFISKVTGAKLYGSASTINLGKGGGVPDSLLQLFNPGSRIELGAFRVTVINSKHTPPFKVLGRSNATDPNHPNIDEPFSQPAKVDKYIEGGTFDIYIEHNQKRFLVKPSTNYVESALKNYPCDVLFLGIAMLGIQPTEFQNNYFEETVKTTGAKTVIPIHWDNFTKPISKPLIALPNMVDNVDAGLKFLIEKAKTENIQIQLMQGECAMEF